MASLRLFNRVCRGLGLEFVAANTKIEKIVAACSKFYIEHTLLSYEFKLYNTVLFISTLNDINCSIVCSTIFTAVITFPVSYGVPVYRTYKAIVHEKLEVINVRN